MTSMALASITRQLARVSLQPVSKALVASNFQSVRYKTGGKKAKKKSANTDKIDATSPPSHQHGDEPSILQQEWVKLQESIAVKGFDTGQITKATTTGKKQRGGKHMRRKKAKEAELAESSMARERALSDLGGGQFPPLRYSDEETERLLKIAYAAIPERAGKRGTRNLKRQKLRWFKVRKARAKLKKQKIRTHERKMEKRSQRINDVLAAKESAAEIRERDRAYQEEVLMRWAENMTASINEEESGEEEVLQEEKQSL